MLQKVTGLNQAHIMLMPKDPASLKGQTSDFNSGGPYIMFEGTGYDHIMIPLEDTMIINQKNNI